MYLNKFTLEEFYTALKISKKSINKEMLLLSSVHISLVFLFVNELFYIKINEIYNFADGDLLLIKIIIDHYYINNNIKGLFLFL